MIINISPEDQKKFKYLKFRNKKSPIKGHFPDFLIVGPQRTGTTWMSFNLRQHDEIFLSFPKELYFFNRLNIEDNRYSKHYYDFKENVFNNPKRAFYEFFKILHFDLIKTGFNRANQLEWYLSFFEDDWISKLYVKNSGKLQPKVRGEATASYAILHPTVRKEIVMLNPDIKIILMVRDPVDRAWSHAKKKFERIAWNDLEKMEDQIMTNYFLTDNQVKNGSYSKQIEGWSKVLKPGNLFIGSYNLIKSDPGKLLNYIYEFLGVQISEDALENDVKKVVNPTSRTKLSANYRDVLNSLFKEEVETLEKTYGISFKDSSFERLIV